MSDKAEGRTTDAVNKVIGGKRVCEMSGAEFLKAVAQVTAELTAPKQTKPKSK